MLGVEAMVCKKTLPLPAPPCLRMWVGSKPSRYQPATLGLDLPLQEQALSRLPSPTGLPMLVYPEAAVTFYHSRPLLFRQVPGFSTLAPRFGQEVRKNDIKKPPGSNYVLYMHTSICLELNIYQQANKHSATSLTAHSMDLPVCRSSRPHCALLWASAGPVLADRANQKKPAGRLQPGRLFAWISRTQSTPASHLIP